MPKRNSEPTVDPESREQWLAIVKQDDLSEAASWIEAQFHSAGRRTIQAWVLNLAAGAGAARIIALLIGRGAKVNGRETDSLRQTPLMAAAQGRTRSHLDCVLRLLELGADPNLEDKIGSSALSHALLEAETLNDSEKIGIVGEIVAALLTHGADASSPGASPAVFTALRLESTSILEQLLEAGASPHGLPQSRKASPRTRRRMARDFGLDEVDVEKAVTGEKMVSLLEVAVTSNRPAAVRMLLDRGADAGTPFFFDKRTPLLAAIESSSTEIIKMLILHGADVNAPQGKRNWTPLMSACFHGAGPETLTLLIESGARLDAAADGKTALSVAWANRRWESVDLLIARGARERGVLGILMPDAPDIPAWLERASLDSGMPVIDVLAGSAADYSGVQPEDVIVELDGNAIRGPADLFATTQHFLAGGSVSSVLMRRGERVGVDFRLGPPITTTLKFGTYAGYLEKKRPAN